MDDWFEQMVLEKGEIVMQELDYTHFEKLNIKYRELRLEFTASQDIILIHYH